MAIRANRKSIIAVIISAIMLLIGFVPSQAGIYATVSGAGYAGGDSIYCNESVTFEINMFNNIGLNIIGLQNGFRLYSNDGTVWQIPVSNYNPDLNSYFDLFVGMSEISIDGSGADTIGIAAVVMVSPGIPDGYDDIIMTIATQFDCSEVGGTICLDSSFFPPAGDWLWAVSGSGTMEPDWDGPHCFTIVQQSTGFLPGVDFSQVDLVLEDSTQENDNNARLGVNIDSLTDGKKIPSGYLNGYTDAGWVIQNLPINPDIGVPEIATYFGLNSSPGENVTELSIYLVFTSEQSVSFSDGPREVYPVDDVLFSVSGFFEDEGASDNKPVIQPDFTDGKDDINRQPPWQSNVECAWNQCVPCAISNCLQYLENRYGVFIPDDNIPGIGGVPANSLPGQHDLTCNRPPNVGLSAWAWMNGKLQYLANNSLGTELELHHQTRNVGLAAGDFASAGMVSVDETNPANGVTINWIVDNVQLGEATEIAVMWSGGGGHAVQVHDEFVDINGNQFFWLLHDRLQAQAGGTEIVAQRVWQLGTNLGITWNGTHTIRLAISTSVCYATGDCNANGIPLEVADLVLFINIYTGNASYTGNLYEYDLNGDCTIDIDDLTLYTDYFVNGMSVFTPYGGWPVATCCNLSCPGEYQWLSPTLTQPSPSARWGHAMAYDLINSVVVLFSGTNNNETWTWDGTDWQQMFPAGPVPSPRVRHKMVYDPTLGKVVLFGGEDGSSTFNDTWVYDVPTNTWLQLIPMGPIPSARKLHAMAYDNKSGNIVMYGGSDASSLNLSDTWIFTGGSWQQVFPANNPGARSEAVMVYEGARENVFLYGGGVGAMASESWSWDGANWSQYSPADDPGPRNGHVMVYDIRRGVTVLFGSTNISMANIWEWNGDNWKKMTATGPAGRAAHAMAYNASQGKAVLFGGVAPGVMNDTWLYPDESITQMYLVGGTSNGIGWSWCLENANLKICDLDVPGVTSGLPAYDVVERFVESINNSGCRSINAVLVPGSPFPTLQQFMVTTGGNLAFDIGVGVQGDRPNCWLPGSGSCSFNPDFGEVTMSGNDCNGNMIDDAADIAYGSSSDINENGIPDECEIFWICGDANADGNVNILDITYLIAYLYLGGPAPDPLASGDVNASETVNILDITYLIAYLYLGGPEPACL